MKKLILAACFCAGLYSGAFAQDSTAIRYAQTITAEDMQQHLQILASDSLEGRETGTRGQKMAAEYIKNHFKELGLQAVGTDGSYYQPFALERRSWGDVYVKAKGQKLENFEEVIYYGNARLPEEKEYEIVFAGHGRPQDYEKLDVSGKAVLIFDTEDKEWRQKLKTAAEKGAVAAIITSGANKTEFTRTVNNAKFFMSRPRLTLRNEKDGPSSSVFFFTAPETAAEIMGTSLEKLQRAVDKKEGGKKRALRKIKPATISIKAERNVEAVETENVLGLVEGTDLKDEIIVITSHYDHLGVGENGEIFNGADDDGSGTTTVLELAEAFAKAKADGNGPRRSILFMTVSGEEKGLLGSEYYVNNPIFPLAKTVTNLNIDMVGRVDLTHEDKPDYVYLIGSDKLSNELHQISENANKLYTGLNLDYAYNDESDPNRYYYRSDHYNFAKNDIPVIFYFNGTHADYHKASDTVEKIEFELMEKRGKLIFFTGWELANRDKRVALDKEVKSKERENK